VYPSRRRALHPGLLAGFVLALLAAQQVLTVPGSGRLVGGVQNALHGPWFAAVMWLCLTLYARRLPDWRGIAAAGLTAVVLAFGTEALQMLTGGDAELSDVGFDLLGAAGATALFCARSGRWRRAPGYLIGTLLLLATLYPLGDAAAVEWQRRAFLPQLVRFGAPFSASLYRANSPAEVVDAPTPWPGIQRALEIHLSNQTWPGVAFDEPLDDWRPYSVLTIDAFVAGSAPLPVTVSVRLDHAAGDHVYRTFTCTPGPCRISLPLTDLFDRATARVNAVVIYSRRRYAGRTLYLGRIELD
jgi:hypothetical protein